MDEMRQMLDQLMGQERNLSVEERKRYKPRTRSYRDKDVCKYFLCGFCPYEEFRRTKNDCGDCPCLHDDDAKREWDALDDRAKESTGYEEDLKRWMDRLLVDLQKRIDTNTERLKATEKPLFLVEDQQRLDAMTARINELLAQSQALGEQGDVDGAQQAMFEAEQVKVQRSVLEQQAASRAGNNAAKNLMQAVCPVSGLIINKEESRIQDHEMGKNFNSWKKLHAVYAQLVERQKQRDEGRRRERYERDRRDRDRPLFPPAPSHRDRDRDRERGGSYRDDRSHSSRNHERGSSRDHGRDSRDGRGRDRDYREVRDGRDKRDKRDRDRSPARPSRHHQPRVDEADFVLEYTNQQAAAAASKQAAAAEAQAQQYYDGSQAYFDPAYAGPGYEAAAAGAQAPGPELPGAAGTPAGGAQDWGVDYGPAKPLQQQDAAYF